MALVSAGRVFLLGIAGSVCFLWSLGYKIVLAEELEGSWFFQLEWYPQHPEPVNTHMFVNDIDTFRESKSK